MEKRSFGHSITLTVLWSAFFCVTTTASDTTNITWQTHVKTGGPSFAATSSPLLVTTRSPVLATPRNPQHAIKTNNPLIANTTSAWLKTRGNHPPKSMKPANKSVMKTTTRLLTMDSANCSTPRTCKDAGRGQDPVIQCWLEVEAEAGRVEWTHPRDVCCCWISTHWHIKVKDENYGIVLDAFEFRLKPGDEFSVTGDNCENTQQHGEIESLIFPAGHMVVCIRSFNSKLEPHSYSFIFSTQPLHTLPVRVDTALKPHVHLGLVSALLYNCSHPYTVPESLKCDMIQQCVGGEDEPPDCHYRDRSLGCDRDWIPLHGQCVKFLFQDFDPGPGGSGDANGVGGGLSYGLGGPYGSGGEYGFDDYGEYGVRNAEALERFYRRQMAGMNNSEIQTTTGDKPGVMADPEVREDLKSPREVCRSLGAELIAVVTGQESNDIGKLVIRGGYGFQTLPLGQTQVSPLPTTYGHLYRFLWKEGDTDSAVIYRNPSFVHQHMLPNCFMLTISAVGAEITKTLCSQLYTHTYYAYACTQLKTRNEAPNKGDFTLHAASRVKMDFRTKLCRDGSLVQTFHPCPRPAKGDQPGDLSFPLFPCTYGPGVHYSVLCDGTADCLDASDETGCSSVNLDALPDNSFLCDNGQVIPASSRCNGASDCFDNSDENDCEQCVARNGKVSITWCQIYGCVPTSFQGFIMNSLYGLTCDSFYTDPFGGGKQAHSHPVPPPAVVDLDGLGLSYLRPLNQSDSCPETHFQCQRGFCIPTFLLNNGKQDCPQGEDEKIPTVNLTCPGFYRCLLTGGCVHSDHVCDGVYHCPYKDDERYCDLTCPENCTCQGHAFKCGRTFDPNLHFHVRYLDLSGIEVTEMVDIEVLQFLQFLNLSFCGLSNLTLKSLPLLKILDLSFNKLHDFRAISFESLAGLTDVNLSGNPMGPQLSSEFVSFCKLASFVSLQSLVMVNMGIEFFDRDVFRFTGELRSLDIRENPLHAFHRDALRGLTKLRLLQTDDPRLCCEVFLQDTELTECSAPEDELSSCSDLLRSDFFRVFLWGQSALAISGNAGVIVYRLFVEKKGTSVAFLTMVINLAVSDFLMGVYLAVIGAADTHYSGNYVSNEAYWRESVVCSAAGFLALVSSEVSAFVIFLITLDRFLVLTFPFSEARLTRRSALLACGAAWGVGVTLASVPLFERDWQFYAQTGICLPLPINRGYSDGQRYSFGVFVVLNFVLCLVIGAGQSFTYISIRRTSQATKQGSQQHEVTIARRLVLVVLTDFVCWLPIGLLGLMASQGSPIPGVVNVWAAIFVLPLNSALNPFLYTISTLRQRWARDKMKTQIERMMGKLHVQIRTWPRDKVEELVNFCIRTQLVERSHVLKLAGVTEVDLAATDLKPRHVCPTVKDLAMLPHDQVEDLIFSLQEAGVLHLDRVLERADFKTPSTTTTTTLHPPPTDDDKMHAESTHTQADRESRDVEVNGRNATAPQAEMVDIFSTQAEVHHVHDIGHENKTLAG